MSVFTRVRDVMHKVSFDDALFVASYVLRYHGVDISKPAQILESIRWIRAALNRPDDSDEGIIQAMRSMPRCGVADILFDAPEGMEQAQSKWLKTQLTWKIVQSVPGLDPILQRKNMAICAEQTERVCGLKFTEHDGAGKADLSLYARRLDGPGKVLGQNYLPNGNDQPLYGELDSSEDWRNPTFHQRVVRHETFGHGCGVSHITTPNSVMNPYLQSLDDWQPGDIAELVKRYGKPVAAPAPVPPAGDSYMVDVRTIVVPGWKYVREGA